MVMELSYFDLKNDLVSLALFSPTPDQLLVTIPTTVHGPNSR